MQLTDEYPIILPSVLPGCNGSINLDALAQDDAVSIILDALAQLQVHPGSTDGDLVGYFSVNSICRRPSYTLRTQPNGAVQPFLRQVEHFLTDESS